MIHRWLSAFALTQVLLLAQPPDEQVACQQLRKTLFAHIAGGQLDQAESAAAAAPDRRCASLVLSDAAGAILLRGRTVESERLSRKSLGILQPLVAPDDPALLRPLYILSASRLNQNKIAQSREALRNLLLVRREGPVDRAMVHGLEAMLLEVEGKLREAEAKFFVTMHDWQEAGLAEAPETAVSLNALGAIYIKQHRFAEARQALDRAIKL